MCHVANTQGKAVKWRGCNKLGAIMADASFAARPQQAAPVSRAERSSARPNGSSATQSADFNRNLTPSRSDSVSAALSLSGTGQRPVQAGGGLLTTGLQFMLAQTRTQEAGAPLPPISNLERARSQYLSTQSRVRDTIVANTILRGEPGQAATVSQATETDGDGRQTAPALSSGSLV